MDPHIHSEYSEDSKTKIKDIIKIAIKKKIDVIAISDHDTIQGSKKAIKQTKNNDNILVIPSIEVSSSKGHILGLGVKENIEKNLSPIDTIKKIHENNGLAIVPHPYGFYRHGIFSRINHSNLNIDGIETLNGNYFLGYGNKRAKKYSIENNISQIGSSDAHDLESIGSCYTKIDCDLTIDSILESIRKNKVIAEGNGKSYFLKRLKI